MKKNIIYILVGFMIITLGLTGCTKNEMITVSLDWTPNTNHTGIYVAKDKGYYEEAGLDVVIIQPASGTAEQLVAAGQAEFGISFQENVTFARLEEMPIVSIATIIQHNTSGFASLKDKGIISPKDFEGKKYGGWGIPMEEATIKALMEKYDADYEKVEILTTGSTDFLAASPQDIDFAWIFEGWTGIEAQIRGIELNYIDVGKENAALDYYTPIIITNEKNIKENADIVEKFMKATTQGYNYAITNPEDAAEILLSNVPELDRELVIKSQEFLSDKYQAEASQWGIQKDEVWQRYTDWLFDNRLIESKIDINEAFTNKFLLEK